jgi:hypothetical protein
MRPMRAERPYLRPGRAHADTYDREVDGPTHSEVDFRGRVSGRPSEWTATDRKPDGFDTALIRRVPASESPASCLTQPATHSDTRNARSKYSPCIDLVPSQREKCPVASVKRTSKQMTPLKWAKASRRTPEAAPFGGVRTTSGGRSC